MGGQREGHKEDDDRAVGTANRHLEGHESVDKPAHLDDEKPRLLGELAAKPVDEER